MMSVVMRLITLPIVVILHKLYIVMRSVLVRWTLGCSKDYNCDLTRLLWMVSSSLTTMGGVRMLYCCDGITMRGISYALYTHGGCI